MHTPHVHVSEFAKNDETSMRRLHLKLAATATRRTLVWRDTYFDGPSTVQLVERKLEVIKLELVCYNTLRLDLTAVEICYSTREAVCL